MDGVVQEISKRARGQEGKRLRDLLEPVQIPKCIPFQGIDLLDPLRVDNEDATRRFKAIRVVTNAAVETLEKTNTALVDRSVNTIRWLEENSSSGGGWTEVVIEGGDVDLFVLLIG
ncbi:hypothetical protein Tco_1569316 [Tanacetum coccineum]